jgi:diguanylate cyclase (GGDEF)-like protein
MQVSILLSLKKNSNFKGYLKSFKKLDFKYSLSAVIQEEGMSFPSDNFDITLHEVSRNTNQDREMLPKGKIANFLLSKERIKKLPDDASSIIIYKNTPFEYLDNLISLALNPIPTDKSGEVLIMSDCPNSNTLIKGILSRIGYSGTYCEYKRLQLKNDGLKVFSCLIIDLDKADKTCEEMLFKITSDNNLSNIPVIVLYKTLEFDTALRLLNMKVSDFIKKPFDPYDFVFRLISKVAAKKSAENFEKRISEEEGLSRKLLELNEELKSVNALNKQLTKALEQQALTDELTGVNNRRQILHYIKRGINHAYDYDMDLGLIIVDIDFFKKVNDTYGHDFGDKVIRETALMISSSLEDEFYLGRIGGEEFVVVLYKTSKKGVVACASKINKNVKKHRFKSATKGIEISITVSLGLTVLRKHENEKSVDCLIKRADEGLYIAKNKGRDTHVFVP